MGVLRIFVLVVALATVALAGRKYRGTGPCVPNDVELPCNPNYNATVARLAKIATDSNGLVTIGSAGQSVQGRDLIYAKVGHGAKKFFTWGRIHGDECVGAEPVLQLVEFMASPQGRKLRNEVTVIAIPIYNPDGSELNTRHNAPFTHNGTFYPNGIDLNRDGVTIGVPPGNGKTNFIGVENYQWWSLYLSEKPDWVTGIHQFGGASISPVNGKKVEVQYVVYPYDISFKSEQTYYRTVQLAQISHDVAMEYGMTANRYDLTLFTAPSRGIASRMATDGKRSLTEEAHVPLGVMDIEIVEACARYDDLFHDLVYDMLKAQVKAIADGSILTTNPTEVVNLPYPIPAQCPGVEQC